MPAVTNDAVKRYLERLLNQPVKVISISEHGKQELAGDLKEYGYGAPLFIEYEAGGSLKHAVLETMSPSSFGHDHFADRAQAILWEHGAFNRLPRHVRSLDNGAFLESGEMVSTGAAREFFLLTEFVEGSGYFHDLDRIRETGAATAEDMDRVRALSDYLASIHAVRRDVPGLYRRRIRDLIGHGECIMGLTDNYPEQFDFIDRDLLKKIEHACVDWRWRIKDRGERLCQVHGDFHPWNILFRKGVDFTVLDRSRGEWGEAADDVTCMTINYLFSSLVRFGRLDGSFEKMFLLFWENYLERTGDRGILEVAAPFLAWRGLVIASPVWYPRLPDGVRKSIFTFILNVLDTPRFEYNAVSRYLRP
ncbi:MAG: aminoglycoside phosphotransferase family protein [Nitrospirota bacterium]|nr:aminoglycoside phosphotransferase family protein [Nitrospirota bacterium]